MSIKTILKKVLKKTTKKKASNKSAKAIKEKSKAVSKAKPVGTPTQRAKGDTISSLKNKMLKAKTYKEYEALRKKLLIKVLKLLKKNLEMYLKQNQKLILHN